MCLLIWLYDALAASVLELVYGTVWLQVNVSGPAVVYRSVVADCARERPLQVDSADVSLRLAQNPQP